MIIVVEGKMKLSDEFVTCQEETKPIGEEGKSWWEETCAIHGYDFEFSPAVYPQDVLTRFEEVKDMDPKYKFAAELYVRDGFVAPDIELLMENAKLRGLLSNLTEVVLMGGML
jgi:hypothetical protein